MSVKYLLMGLQNPDETLANKSKLEPLGTAYIISELLDNWNMLNTVLIRQALLITDIHGCLPKSVC